MQGFPRFRGYGQGRAVAVFALFDMLLGTRWQQSLVLVGAICHGFGWIWFFMAKFAYK
jgi:hypothetical protein